VTKVLKESGAQTSQVNGSQSAKTEPLQDIATIHVGAENLSEIQNRLRKAVQMLEKI